jgi:DNA-binding NarL/FixJ family response regulator
MPDKTTLLVEDHAILRDGLRLLLERNGGFEIVAETDNGHDAVALAVKHSPELILTDISMPGKNGTETIPLIRNRLPDAKIIVLTMHRTEEYVRACLAAGANGYVLKEDSQVELLSAIEKVFSGQTYLSSGICNHVVSGFLTNKQATTKTLDEPVSWDLLTLREREVLKLVAEGRRNREIAAFLSISVKTVEKHRAGVMKKLGANNVSELTAFAIRKGLISSD